MSVTQRWDIRSLTFTIQDEIGSQETKGPGVAQELYQVVGEQVVSPHSVQHCRRINTTSLNAQTVLTHCSSAEAGLTPTLLLTAHSGHALGGLLKHTKHITQRKGFIESTVPSKTGRALDCSAANTICKILIGPN